jgi:hypothetical protein
MFVEVLLEIGADIVDEDVLLQTSDLKYLHSRCCPSIL